MLAFIGNHGGERVAQSTILHPHNAELLKVFLRLFILFPLAACLYAKLG